MSQLETKRLILRPFEEGDAEMLFSYARDPRVGPPAGWKPHESLEESREIIRTVFSEPETYAVVHRQDGRVIGSAGFTGRHRKEAGGPDDEIGYSLDPVSYTHLSPPAPPRRMRWGYNIPSWPSLTFSLFPVPAGHGVTHHQAGFIVKGLQPLYPDKAEGKATLPDDPPGLVVAVIVVAPDGVEPQVLKPMAQQLRHRLGDESTPPIGRVQGVANLVVLSLIHI